MIIENISAHTVMHVRIGFCDILWRRDIPSVLWNLLTKHTIIIAVIISEKNQDDDNNQPRVVTKEVTHLFFLPPLLLTLHLMEKGEMCYKIKQ